MKILLFLSFLILICVATALGLWGRAWTLSRSRQMLTRWALENQYRLLNTELRELRRGPFLWTSSKGQIIYHIVVRTSDGQIQRGWVRCGSFLWGVSDERVEVMWEDLPINHHDESTD
jgi:hypothetical protein